MVDDVLNAHAPGERFCTACVAVVRPTASGARVTLSSAGHPLPIVARHSGTTTATGRPGALLGAGVPATAVDTRVDLAPGDVLVLYTDGVTEAHRPGHPLLSDEGLARVLAVTNGASAAVLADRVVEATLEAGGGGPPRDDVAVVVLRPLI